MRQMMLADSREGRHYYQAKIDEANRDKQASLAKIAALAEVFSGKTT